MKSESDVEARPATGPDKKQSFIGKTWGFIVTLCFVLVAGAAVFFGTQFLSSRAANAPAPSPTQTPLVRTQDIQLQDRVEISRRFVGQIEAAQQIDLAFETGGTVTTISVDDGDRVKQGDIIARLDTRLLRAERKRLRAAREAVEIQRDLAQRTAKRRDRLQRQGFVSGQQADQDATSVAQLNARRAEIDASLTSIAIQLEKAVIRSPLTGRVTKRLLDPGTTTRAGQAVVALIEDGAPRFRVGLDPRLAEQLDTKAQHTISIRQRRYTVQFAALLPDINPTTRTREALFSVIDGDEVLIGDTATIDLPELIDQAGYWLPLSALKNGVRGTWEVLTVRKDGDVERVGLEAVQILYGDENRAYVSGTLKRHTRIIADGAHRVVVGQRVQTQTPKSPPAQNANGQAL